MTQAEINEWVGENQAKRTRDCAECSADMERRARTMMDQRPWECPECGHRQ